MIDLIISRWQEAPRVGLRYFEDLKIIGRTHELGAFGEIKITVCKNRIGSANDAIYFKTDGSPIPYVSWQNTYEEFRGRGLSGALILAAYNELGSQASFLHSDVAFWNNSHSAYSNMPARRVWEKMHRQGVAIYRPFETVSGNVLDRWHLP